jgi:hypothetical protein
VGRRELKAFNRHKRAHHLTGNGGIATRTAHAAGFREANREALDMALAAETGAHIAFASGGPMGDPDAYRKALTVLIEWLRDEEQGPPRYLVKFDTSGWKRLRTISPLENYTAKEVLDTRRGVVLKSISTLGHRVDFKALRAEAETALSLDFHGARPRATRRDVQG